MFTHPGDVDHYDIPDVTDADSVSLEDFECSDPWGDFKWWMYTEKIRQSILDYLYQNPILIDYLVAYPNVHQENFLFKKIGLDTSYSIAHDLLPKALEELLEDRADQAAIEELLLEEDACKDPMYCLLQTIEAAKEFGCENDKCFAYEGLDLLSQENVDEHVGHGDPSQWTY